LAQDFDEATRYFSGTRNIRWIERNRSDALVAAATVFSASEARFWSALARFHGLVPRETFARTADALNTDRINTFGMEQVRNEFVIAFEVEIADVEKSTPSRASLRFAKEFQSTADDVQGAGPEMFSDNRPI